MTKFKELKNKNDKELGAMLTKAKEDLQTLKFKVAGQQYKNVRGIRVQKQLVAHILTLQKQRKIAGPAKVEPVVSKKGD